MLKTLLIPLLSSGLLAVPSPAAAEEAHASAAASAQAAVSAQAGGKSDVVDIGHTERKARPAEATRADHEVLRKELRKLRDERPATYTDPHKEAEMERRAERADRREERRDRHRGH